MAALALSTPGDAYLIAAVLFCVACLTDMIDGKLARYSQRSSPLGVFLDTTSDKILVSLTLIALAVAHLVPIWVVLVIVGREFLISGLRSFAASCNEIISAHIWGKGKAAITMVALGLLLFAADGRAGGMLARVASHAEWSTAFTVCSWLLYVAAFLTVISGLRYLVDAWPLFRPEPVASAVPPQEPRRMVAGGER